MHGDIIQLTLFNDVDSELAYNIKRCMHVEISQTQSSVPKEMSVEKSKA